MAKAVVFENISKRFRLQSGRSRSLQELVVGALHRRNRQESEDFWALRDVSFSVEQGETLGLIGPNGSGKSTVLKLISGILQPTSGSVAVNGRISALLELGTGFHPDLTGRENVFLYGSILGLSRREMAQRIDEIIAFSEIGNFIDSPVKHYSTGMFVRLGFAVAVNVDPDILLVDEVLAVGDSGFQQKCLDEIRAFQSRGIALIVVSHDVGIIGELCSRVLWLHEGRVERVGDAPDIVGVYHRTFGLRHSTHPSTDRARILRVRLLDSSGREIRQVTSGESVVLEAEIEFHDEVEQPNYGFYIVPLASTSTFVYSTNTARQKLPVSARKKGERVVMRSRLSMHLVSGMFAFGVAVTCADSQETLAWDENAVTVKVRAGPGISGIADLHACLEVSAPTERRA